MANIIGKIGGGNKIVGKISGMSNAAVEAELALKADKAETGARLDATDAQLADVAMPLDFILENLITNGDFSTNKNGWVDLNVSSAAVGGKGVFTATAAYGKFRSPSFACVQNRKYYFRVIVDSTATSQISASISGVGPKAKTKTGAEVLSNIVNWTPAGAAYRVDIQDNRTSAWDSISVDDVLVLDLTTIFGAGNEPPIDQLEEILALYPNSYFNGKVKPGNKAMTNYWLSELRDKDLMNSIRGTKQIIAYNPDSTISSVTHKDSVTNATVRADVYTYGVNTITEVRTLTKSGRTLTLINHTDTGEQEVL